MARLQIGIEGRFVGRGLFRRVFGSGPFRVTPVDVALGGGDVGRVTAAVQVVAAHLAGQPAGRYRLGQAFDLQNVRLFMTVKAA